MEKLFFYYLKEQLNKHMFVLFSICFLVANNSSAQQRTTSATIIVTGIVKDEKGAAMSGVTVKSDVGKSMTITDNEGKFSLNVPSTARQIIVSYVGYSEQKLNITKNPITVSMGRDDRSLDEVVVVGYGSQKRKEITGSMSTVKGDAVANKPVQSFEQALGGRAAGVQVTIPNGVLNAPPVFRVRGTNSISLSSYPLIVIDGVPSFTGDFSSTNSAGNALAALNPNDIESIDIAKDAAASAIYGSRAANGVVFVTTRKGKQGKPRVMYDGNIGYSQVFGLPKLLDAFQYTEFKNKALANAGLLVPGTTEFRLTNGPDGNPINTNWYDYIYRTGIQSSNTISVSGANDNTSYYFSGGYTNQKGIIQKNDFKRITLLMNIDHKISKAISVGGKIQYSSEKNLAAISSGSLNGEAFNTAGIGRIPLATSPNVSPYLNDGSYNVAGSNIGIMNNLGVSVGFANPVVSLDLNRSNSETNRVLGNIYLQVKPFKWLTIKTAYGIDNAFVDNDLYGSPISNEGFSNNGSVSGIFSQNLRWVLTNTAQVDYTFSNKHNTSLLIGAEQQKTDSRAYGLNRIGVNDPNFTQLQAGWQTPNTTGLFLGENYLLSYFGRIQYSYSGKYFINGNVRRDGASQLGNNSKFGTFWGTSAAWDISKETFWTNLKADRIFSSLRFKASYGIVGNIGGLANFASLSTFGSSLYGGNGTLFYSQAGNPNLTWETSKKTDIGFTYGIFKERITGELGFYKSNIDGILLNVPQPPSAGLPTTVPTNVGTMYNQGIEFSISGLIVANKNFSWNTSFNIANNKNAVTSLAPGLSRIVSSTSNLEQTNVSLPGYSIAHLFVTRTAGVDPATGRRIFINAAGQRVFYQRVVPTGQFDWSFADGTKAPAVSSADAVPYANTQPKVFGGFENTVRYKNFELSALFVYQYGSYLYFGTNSGLRDQRFWNNSVDVLNAWSKSGDQAQIARPVFGDNVSNGSLFALDINVFKADFVKLRNLTLAFNFPEGVLKKAKLSSARFYITGNNLLILTKYPGPDPEVSSNGNTALSFGVDRNTVGNQRGFMAGIQVSF